MEEPGRPARARRTVLRRGFHYRRVRGRLRVKIVSKNAVWTIIAGNIPGPSRLIFTGSDLGSASRKQAGDLVRLTFLDSIRGVAAFVVLTAHLNFATDGHAWFLDLWVLRTFRASVFAVSLFFVLSGFVLFLQVENDRINYVRFVIRRAFRILPACAVVVTISYLIYVTWTPLPATRSEFLTSNTWPPGIFLPEYFNHLWLGGSTDLLRPIWSLIVEWRVSLVFPLLVLLFRWSRAALAVLAIPIIAIATHTAALDFATATMVAFYACFFVLGMFIAAYRFRIILFLSSNRWLRVLLVAICIYYVWFRSESATATGYLQEGLLSGAFIILCMSTPWARQLLRSPPLRYLGRISYSLYLVHMVCIGILFRVLPGANPLATAGLVIIVSIVAADLLNRFVEIPANRLGRRIAGLGLATGERGVTAVSAP